MNPAIPEPTRDFAHGVRNIAEYGLTLVPDVLTGDRLTATREAFYRAVDSDRTRGREAKFSLDYASDDTNQRVWNVLSRDPVFEDLAFHPLAVNYVKAILGWPALLGYKSEGLGLVHGKSPA